MKERGADMEEQPQAWIIEQLDMPIHYINGQGQSQDTGSSASPAHTKSRRPTWPILVG
jgi:hypothetical protein